MLTILLGVAKNYSFRPSPGMSSLIPEAEQQNLWHNISGIKQWQALDNFVVIFGDHGDHAEMELTATIRHCAGPAVQLNGIYAFIGRGDLFLCEPGDLSGLSEPPGRSASPPARIADSRTIDI